MERGEPVQRRLAHPETHDYRFYGKAGEYAELVLTQLGVDLELALSGPEGRPHYEVDGPYARHGTEYLCVPMAKDGLYRVRIKAFNEHTAGEYRLRLRISGPDGDVRARAAAFDLVHRASQNEDPDAAALLLNDAAEAWQAAGDGEQAAMALWRRGWGLENQFRLNEVVQCYERAITLLEGVDKPRLAAIVRYYLGVIFHKQGQLNEALAQYEAALAVNGISERDRAAMLEAKGKTCNEAGFFEEAGPVLKEALAINEGLGDIRNIASVYGGMGWWYHRLGKYEEALAMYERGLDLSTGRFGNETRLLNLYRAKTWNALGNPRKALESLQGDIARQGKTSPQLEVNIADALLQLENYAEARSKLRAVLPFFENVAVDHPYVLYKLARAERGLGNVAEALSLMERTLSLTGSLGREGMNRSERMAFLANRYEETAFMLDLLVETSPAPAPRAFALAASARLRLFQPVFSETCGSAGDDRELRQYIRELADAISLMAWRKENGETDTAQSLNAMLNHYNDALDKLCPQPIHEEKPVAPEVLFQMARALADRETTLLFFAMGLRKTYLWIFSESGVSLFPLASPQTIDGLAREYHDTLGGPPSPDRQDLAERRASELGDALFSRAWSALSGKRLAIVPDGGLFYVPIQALPLPKELGGGPLATRFEVVYLPSLQYAEALNRRARATRGEGMLVVADPRFGDDFSRLAGSHREAEAILELGESSGIETRALFGTDANRAKLLDMKFLCEAQYLHFSTHGFFYEDWPELSALVLSTRDERGRARNGFIRIQDIAGLELKARLVVLSACRTALGKELRGAGMVGFANAFSQAGCQGVLVSLWRVDDFATAALMERFYRELLHHGKSPAEALRRAQVSMVSETRWKNPYYWAGFIYQGAW